MADTAKRNIAYRCPVCFAREIDVVLHKKENGTYYCVKCGYTGSLEEIRGTYEAQKKKYRLMTTRITVEDLESCCVPLTGTVQENGPDIVE